MTRRLASLFLALFIAALGAGGLAGPGRALATPAHRATTPTIVIKNFGFSGDLTVQPGATVKVVNKDAFTHTLTYKSHGVFKPGKFDTGNIRPNHAKTFVAPKKQGSYHFGCMHHLEMHGVLVVHK